MFRVLASIGARDTSRTKPLHPSTPWYDRLSCLGFEAGARTSIPKFLAVHLTAQLCSISHTNCNSPRGSGGRIEGKVDRKLSESSREGRLERALRAVKRSRERGSRITTHLLHSLLQQCIREKNLPVGRKVHSFMVEEGLDSNTYLSNSLIRLFASCGNLLEADQVFCKIVKPTTHTWEAIISAYADHGDCKQAIKLYQRMQHSGSKANDFIYVAALKACAGAAALKEGRLIHAHILETGYEANLYVGNTLLDMYVKCKSPDEAWKVFLDLPQVDAVSWNTMITGYTNHGRGHEALEIFECMCKAGVQPDRVTFVSTLKACAWTATFVKGQEIHALLMKSGLYLDVVLGSVIVDMYAKCGSLKDAQEVFENLPEKNIVSWNALLSGYTHYGQAREALLLFHEMQRRGIGPDKVTMLIILKACGNAAALDQGRQVHEKLVELELDSDVELGNTLVDMYAKCWTLDEAHSTFNALKHKTVVSWNAMVGGYVQQGHGEEALQLLWQMQQDGVSPERVTFLSILKACGSIGALDAAKQCHIQLIERGWESDLAIGNSLIDMYSMLGSLSQAKHVFDKLLDRDLISWNAMIGGCVQQGHAEEALQLYEQMQLDGVLPSKATFMIILKACGRLAALDLGKQIHAALHSMRLELDAGLSSVLVDMYVRCGSLVEARHVFDRLTERKVSAWNVLIEGCVEHGHDQEALALFQEMQQAGIKANKLTIVSVLRACGGMSALDKGTAVHAQLCEETCADIAVGSTLVDMYAKCGHLDGAKQVFDHLPERNAVSWNALIGGYARHGHAQEALLAFTEMQEEGLKPTDVTFLSVLSACSHAGLLDTARKLFHSMSDHFGINPGLHHVSCLVDLLARSGHVLEAEDLILQMPLQPHAAMWRSVLAACQSHGNLEVARRSFQRIVELEPGNAAAYDLMANIYSAAGWLDEEADTRRKMAAAEAKGETGCSWIEHEHYMHRFAVRDTQHPLKDHIYATLRSLPKDVKQDEQQLHIEVNEST